MFFKRNKELVIHCYTFDKTIYEFHKPDRAIKFVPEGWKSAPKNIPKKVFAYNPSSTMEQPNHTIKSCVGFLKLFSSGFIIPSWSDILLEPQGEGAIHHSPSHLGMNESMPRDLYWNGLYPEYSHVKLLSPWVIKTDEEIDFTFNSCDWNNTERASDFHVLSGVIDFKYQHCTHVNAFIKNNIHIKAGEPLAHLIPMTERKWRLEHHLVSSTDFNNILGTKILSYTGDYTRRKKIIQENEKSKCPFGFGR